MLHCYPVTGVRVLGLGRAGRPAVWQARLGDADGTVSQRSGWVVMVDRHWTQGDECHRPLGRGESVGGPPCAEQTLRRMEETELLWPLGGNPCWATPTPVWPVS